MSKAVQRQELIALKLKGNEYPDNDGLIILRIGIEYRRNLAEEDRVVVLVGEAGQKYKNTLFSTTQNRLRVRTKRSRVRH